MTVATRDRYFESWYIISNLDISTNNL